MPLPRVRIDLFDSEGNKISITLDGNITREKVLHVLDLVELLGGGRDGRAVGGNCREYESKFQRVLHLIERRFPIGLFTSQDVMLGYEEEYKQTIGLSTVSTYLARLSARGFLYMGGSSIRHEYRLDRRGTVVQNHVQL